MSITDELREYTKHYSVAGSMKDKTLTAIADRIDAEHERICYDYQREHDDWVYIRDTCWVELPKDADGVPIHIGDSMELVADDDGCPGFCPVIREVEAIGTGVFFAWDKVGGRFAQYLTGNYRHHHEPTVEDVLTEFALACEDAGNAGPKVARIAAEYAKRLTLVEGEDA